MSVARCLGVEDLENPQMMNARRKWPRWCAAEPALAVVDELVDLPDWMRRAAPPERDVVLTTLAKLGTDDTDAIVSLTWLLAPGASSVARRLSDLSPDIDCLIAGQLWVTARSYDWTRPHRVAATILNRTRREVLAELGIGEPARRRDRVWASTIPLEHIPEPPVVIDEPDSSEELADLLREALDTGALSEDDRGLLLDLAYAADSLGAPLRRGSGGLSTPSVAELVSREYEWSARTVRRRAVAAIDGLSMLAKDQGDGSAIAL